MKTFRGRGPRRVLPACLLASAALLLATSGLADGGESHDDGAALGTTAGIDPVVGAGGTTTSTTAAPTTSAAPTSVPAPANELAPRPEDTAPPPPAASGDTTAAPPDAREEPPSIAADAHAARCVVTLHGKGGSGSAPRSDDGVTMLAPTGNAAGWGGRQWRYDDPASFAQARAAVRGAVDDAGCGRIVVHGFSNGAAFAAALYCHGETLDGRLARVIVDDPVTDAGVVPCGPAPGVAVSLYWTGALAATAPAGWSCAQADWTCAGGTSIGIDAYAAALGVAAKPSPMGGHAMYAAAPERLAF